MRLISRYTLCKKDLLSYFEVIDNDSAAMFSETRRKYLRNLRPRSRTVVLALMVAAFVLYMAIKKNWSDISTEREKVWKTLKAQCRTCSLVTNSGDLIGSYVGTKIDEADCVIRINNAPTTGFEDDVGRKTTIRIVDGENFDFIIRSLPLGEPTPLHMIMYYDKNLIGEASDMLYQERQLGKQSSTLLNRNDNILQRVEQSVAQNLDRRRINKNKDGIARLSVAFVAFMFSHEICRREVNVYGMSSPSYCDKYQHYAHDAPKNYYPPGDKERKCPHSRNLDSKLWTSNFDTLELYAVFALAKLTDKIRFREYTMDDAAAKKK